MAFAVCLCYNELYYFPSKSNERQKPTTLHGWKKMWKKNEKNIIQKLFCLDKDQLVILS